MDYSKIEFSKVIDRINELYKKSKNEGLTEEEKKEQKEIREYYLSVIRGNFKAQLSQVKKVSSQQESQIKN
ncbi:hypothetical protein GCM10008909_11210 [Hathewaya limosa]